MLLRRLAFEGISPPGSLLERSLSKRAGPGSAFARASTFDSWSFSREGHPFALAMVDRLNAGLTGLGPDGRSLAFHLEGRTFIAFCTARGDEPLIGLWLKESWVQSVTAWQRVLGGRKT